MNIRCCFSLSVFSHQAGIRDRNGCLCIFVCIGFTSYLCTVFVFYILYFFNLLRVQGVLIGTCTNYIDVLKGCSNDDEPRRGGNFMCLQLWLLVDHSIRLRIYMHWMLKHKYACKHVCECVQCNGCTSNLTLESSMKRPLYVDVPTTTAFTIVDANCSGRF